MDDHRPSGRPPIDGSEPLNQNPAATGESLGDTVTGIIQDVQNIIRGEVELAKTEVKEDVGKLGKAAGMIGAAAFLALVGFLEMWISAGIVGLALLIIGAILGVVGKNQMQEANMVPDKTIDSLKEDKEWASRQINSVTK